MITQEVDPKHIFFCCFWLLFSLALSICLFKKKNDPLGYNPKVSMVSVYFILVGKLPR